MHLQRLVMIETGSRGIASNRRSMTWICRCRQKRRWVPRTDENPANGFHGPVANKGNCVHRYKEIRTATETKTKEICTRNMLKTMLLALGNEKFDVCKNEWESLGWVAMASWHVGWRRCCCRRGQYPSTPFRFKTWVGYPNISFKIF